MERKYFSEHVWYNPEKGHYIMLDITDEIGKQVPQIIEGVELLPKDEYHVSLVPAQKLSEDEAVVRSIVEDVRCLLQANPGAVSWGSLGDERYVCKEDDEVTLVAPAAVVGLSGLREVVRRHVPGFNPAFPHVTLLKSANSPYGIGISSSDDLAAYCYRLEAVSQQKP